MTINHSYTDITINHNYTAVYYKNNSSYSILQYITVPTVYYNT